MTPARMIGLAAAVIGALFLVSAVRAQDDDASGGANIGERLFLETRFAEFFYTNSGGNPNATLTNGDPVMNYAVSPIYGSLPGPFAGQSMNCRNCHMVEELENSGNRTYCDFSVRSPIPDLGDGRATTTRNAMPLVDALLPRATPLFLHFDGQFTTVHDLVIATLTGRNYGWQPSQYETAIHHIADIIRYDNGSNELAQDYGGFSYAITLEGLGEVPPQYSVPDGNLMDVTVTDTNDPFYVTDDEIVDNVADLIQQYMLTLVFAQDNYNNFIGSPFDVFLIKNGLPQQPSPGETPLQYARRLLKLVAALTNPQWVSDPADGHFVTNAKDQLFQFGTNELVGLEIFLSDRSNLAVATNLQQRGITTGIEVGNCLACHTPPYFSDYLFHNNGAAQAEYDDLFGPGSFMAVSVPDLCARQTNYDAGLPPTTNHPNASGIFDLPPQAGFPGQMDLGLWNVFANPDFPTPQPDLQYILPILFSVPAPQISSASLAGSNFVFGGNNGTPGWSYQVLASTDLSQPLANWTAIATNSFAGNQFSVTNAVVPGTQQQFYAVTLGTLPAAAALPRTIALFQTPTVRDLVSSEPYMHTGQLDTIEQVIAFYQNSSSQARAGTLRNADPQLNTIQLDNSATAPLAAFLRALDEEDYADIPCPCP